MVVASWEVAIQTVVLTEVSYFLTYFSITGDNCISGAWQALKVADLVWFFNGFIDEINWLMPAGWGLPSAGWYPNARDTNLIGFTSCSIDQRALG